MSWTQLVPSVLRPFAIEAREAVYRVYQKKLEDELQGWQIPEHIGIVMDGNRRYAKDEGAEEVIEGHNAGADKLDEVLSWCEEANVRVVTVWGFSLDNFARSLGEVGGLMSLFERKFLDIVTDSRIHRDRIRVRSIGRTDLLPIHVRLAIQEAERATEHYERRLLNVGLAYGGRAEIIDAFGRYLADAESRGESIEEARKKLDEDAVSAFLYTADVPDPDLLIRTSGEVRMSGFLLWQSAYSEFYFCDTHWPAFRKIDFLRALRAYHSRQRRFGR